MTIYKASLSLISLLRKAKTIGGKYLKRWQVSNPRTGKMKWVYKYKPISQRGAHEVTGKTFEKKTGGSQEEHKNAVEKALQSGNRVSLHVLRDYPDLVQKYGMSKRLERADKINAKVKEIREKNKASEKNTNEPVSAADNNSKGEQSKMNTQEKINKAINKVKSLPLKGSEKQIKYAQGIILEKLQSKSNNYSDIAGRRFLAAIVNIGLINAGTYLDMLTDSNWQNKTVQIYQKLKPDKISKFTQSKTAWLSDLPINEFLGRDDSSIIDDKSKKWLSQFDKETQNNFIQEWNAESNKFYSALEEIFSSAENERTKQ